MFCLFDFMPNLLKVKFLKTFIIFYQYNIKFNNKFKYHELHFYY